MAQIHAIHQRTFKLELVEICAALWMQLGDIRKALTAVNRCALSLETRKNQLFLSLNELENQINGHVNIIDGTSKAVKYDSCEW